MSNRRWYIVIKLCGKRQKNKGNPVKFADKLLGWCLKDRIMVLKISFSSRSGAFEYLIINIDKVEAFAFSLSLSWW